MRCRRRAGRAAWPAGSSRRRRGHASQGGLARSADPDRRVRLLHRSRALADIGVRPAWPVVRRPFVGPRREDRVDRLVGDRAAARERHAERVEFALDVAGADAEDQASVRERVDRGERLGGLRAACWYAATYTFVISRVRCVRAARYASVATGSNHVRRHRLRPARAGWRRDGTRRRRGSRRRRTPSRRAAMSATGAFAAPTPSPTRIDIAWIGQLHAVASTPSGTMETVVPAVSCGRGHQPGQTTVWQFAVGVQTEAAAVATDAADTSLPPNGVLWLRCVVLIADVAGAQRACSARNAWFVSAAEHVVVQTEVGAVGDARCLRRRRRTARRR